MKRQESTVADQYKPSIESAAHLWLPNQWFPKLFAAIDRGVIEIACDRVK